MRVLLIVLSFASLVQAADQTILGKQLAVKDPQPGVDATKRVIVGRGLETNSANTVVGDPTVAGATLTVFADGTTATSQTYTLPASLWAPVPGGFKYKDPQLTQGPVTTAAIKLLKGTFQVKARVLGKNGGITVVPPNVGTGGCVLLEIPDADPITGDPERYHVLFLPSSTIKKNDDSAFVIKEATAQGVCPQACTPGAPGCGWGDGDMVTYTQGAWSDYLPATETLIGNYDTVYGSTMGVVEVGLPGAAGFSIRFGAAQNVMNYLPAAGVPGALDADMINPTSTSSGSFGGETLGLRLNIDFSDAGVLFGNAGVAFGDLRVCGTAAPALNGFAVRDIMAIANTLLGGGAGPVSISTDFVGIVAELNGAFGAGGVSAFAQDHLVNGACP